MTGLVRGALVLALLWTGHGLGAVEIPRPPARAMEAGPNTNLAAPVVSARPAGGADAEGASRTGTDQRFQRFSAYAPRAVSRPGARPATVVQQVSERRVSRQRGALCGDPDIQGDPVGTIDGPGGCGVEGAVRIRSIAGVALQSNPTVDCQTAAALKTWITRGIKPAVGTTGGGLARLRVVAHYACRNRIGGSSGTRRLSEHALGHAVDIAGIGLRSGREITVLTDWNRRGDGAILRRIWRSACGPFGTVLGPNANAAHRDHFHVDTARYRSGSYCE